MTERVTYDAEAPLLTLRQSADFLHVSQRTFERYVRDGKVRIVRLPSGHRRVRRSDLEAMLAGGAA
jgi:excisionase family DNA binding protein